MSQSVTMNSGSPSIQTTELQQASSNGRQPVLEEAAQSEVLQADRVSLGSNVPSPELDLYTPRPLPSVSAAESGSSQNTAGDLPSSGNNDGSGTVSTNVAGGDSRPPKPGN